MLTESRADKSSAGRVEFSSRPVLFLQEILTVAPAAKSEGALCALHDVLKINYSRGFVNAL